MMFSKIGKYGHFGKRKKPPPFGDGFLFLLGRKLFQQVENSVADKHPEDYTPDKCNN